MFSWQLDDELALLFLQPDMASELFALCNDNREYLSQWLPWPPLIQRPVDSALFIRSAIEKFARGEGLTTAIEYQGEVVGVIGYNSIDQDLGKVVIGYWLAERWQGKRHHHPGLPGADPSRLRRDGDGEGGDQRRPPITNPAEPSVNGSGCSRRE